ncbi:hypothetical protein ILUMI_27552 [Ignelater luminosus]|uniref:ABC transmembrane type-2 domain-containing protein n=1 Tax=Ignelater luminosus TaxID=2038154 RepID=A0A8K0C3F7_IGNLU|nr:hypothetical protein ILUMI_27552 [Ignelater luminosus]
MVYWELVDVDLALYGEFSIRETLFYFGWIAGMSNQKIDVRSDFLVNFLMLPDANRRVKELSGGQQRRVSLASALIHEPELLILDEPTVGVDPLLRQNIWAHLVDITRGGLTTVIITTHYIDETRQAHLIGLMRGGYFLAEESPEKLLTQFRTQTLEDVFLKLSVIQNLGRRRRSSIAQEVAVGIPVPQGVVNDSAVLDDVDSGEACEISGEFGDNISISSRGCRRVSIAPSPEDEGPIAPVMEIPPDDVHPTKISDYLFVFKGNHMKALVWKNLLWMIRNIPVMLFIIALPVAQIVLFCLSIGHDPVNLPVAVVNYEANNSINCEQSLTCNTTQLSCSYLGYLEKRALNLIYYDTEDHARESVLKGKTYASIIVRENYSEALRARVDDWRNSLPWDIEASEIDVIRDLTSKDIANYLKVYMYDSFQNFVQDFLETCGINRKVISLPIRWETPIYGLAYPNFTDFATPGIILTVIFFLAVALTSGAMLIERNEGSLERSLVIGISGVELLTSHVICQFIVMVGQSIMVIVCAFAIFDNTIKGPLYLVIILTLLTGFCGMCFGFVVSCVCDTERTATYMAMGSFLPIVMLCGIIWPIEAMDQLLQLFSFFLPLTKATESLRSILQRGWGISTFTVYMGFISISVWIIIFLSISLLLLKFKKG